MPTILLMLGLMTGPWLAVRGFSRQPPGKQTPRAAAALGLALLFSFTALGHFVKTNEMALMLPPWVPGRVALVYVTGVIEIAFALGFIFPRTRRLAGWAAATALVLFFPANVYAALNHTGMGGHADGPAYLLIRAPLQLAILLWIWFLVLRSPADRLSPVK